MAAVLSCVGRSNGNAVPGELRGREGDGAGRRRRWDSHGRDSKPKLLCTLRTDCKSASFVAERGITQQQGLEGGLRAMNLILTSYMYIL